MTYDPYNQQPPGGQPYGGQPGPYGQQPGPYGQPQYGYGGYPQKPLDTNTALIAMISSIVGLLCCCPGIFVGIIMGHIALSKIKRGEATGHGQAIAALAIGYGAVALNIILLATGVTTSIIENGGFR